MKKTKRIIKLVIVAGARPNLIKASALLEAARKYKEIRPYLVYTGQHYHRLMSEVFWKDLHLPLPYADLAVGSASHALQTARVMIGFERVCLALRPDIIMVVGDVNSTLAAALVGAKLGIKVAHVEAGLRSFDKSMPEEINRILTDQLSDYLYASEASALANLQKEGIGRKKIHYVGNVMIDTLFKFKNKVRGSDILYRLGLGSLSDDCHCEERSDEAISRDCFARPLASRRSRGPAADSLAMTVTGELLGKPAIKYALLTLHRPANVDDRQNFKKLLSALSKLSKKITIIFPVHPRTQKMLRSFGFHGYFSLHNLRGRASVRKNQINCIDPLSYIDFIKLMSQAEFVLTDSGGIQEESTVLGVPCLTVRENTERPVTIGEGTNTLVGSSASKIIREAGKIINSKLKKKRESLPKFWDGKAAERIMRILVKNINGGNKWQGYW